MAFHLLGWVDPQEGGGHDIIVFVLTSGNWEYIDIATKNQICDSQLQKQDLLP